MAEIQNTGQYVKQHKLSFIADENAKWDSHFRKLYDSLLLQIKHNLTLRSINHAPLVLPKLAENLCLHKNLHMNV